MSKKGFTLIELSIVLVIISLIVGGVIGGKSLVESARLQNVVREFNVIRTSVNSFYLAYDAYPGDFREGYDYFANGSNTVCGTDTAVAQGCNGNGDGRFGYAGVYYQIYESIRAWRHLNLADLLPNVANEFYQNYNCMVTSEDGGCSRNSPNVMLSDYKKNTGYLFVNPATYADATPPNYYGQQETFIVLSNPNGGAGSTSNVSYMLGTTEGVMTPANAKNIDKKMDDGLPTRGKMLGISTRSATFGDCDLAGVDMTQIDSTASSNTPYNVAEKDRTCTIMLNITG